MLDLTRITLRRWALIWLAGVGSLIGISTAVAWAQQAPAQAPPGPEKVLEFLSAHAAMNSEVYYWWTIVVMWLIHCGFMTYETGVARRKNMMHVVMKNIGLIPVVTVSMYFPGWWLYNAMVDGFVPRGTSDPLVAASIPWGPNLGPNLQDHLTGVFWGAFILFSWTTASIMSGAVIERIRQGAFLVLAALLGSVIWIVDAAWGWHPNGWLAMNWGFHDAIAGGVVHGVAGAFTLGVLFNLGPRIGKFAPDGTPRYLPPHNLWMTVLGLFFIFTGFFGFYAACLVFFVGPEQWLWGNIYGSPTTLGSIFFNYIMGWSGGAMAGYMFSKPKRDPFWYCSCALAGVISVSAGADIFYPPLGFLVGFIGAIVCIYWYIFAERVLKVDDAVGAVAVHGAAGFWGVLAVGLFAAGYPTGANNVPSTLLGQIIGILAFIPLGFVPGFVVSWLFKRAGLLRIPEEVEMVGQDTYVYGDMYPEFSRAPEPAWAPLAGSSDAPVSGTR